LAIAGSLVVVISILGLITRGEDRAAVAAILFFGIIGLGSFFFSRTSVISLEWRGSVLHWIGIFGNRGTVDRDEIVEVATGFQLGRTLIRLRRGPPLRAGGWSYQDIRSLVYGSGAAGGARLN
jgi:hypothetical protein